MSTLFFPLLPAWLKRSLAALMLLAAMGPLLADEGHNHGDAPAATSTASLRLQTHSDLFELVGIVDQGKMTLYLDRYATNEPVLNAKIEYESGSHKGVAAPQADGTYLMKFDALAKPGELPFSFTITAGADTDLLTADLDLKDAHDAHHDENESSRTWLQWLALGFALVAALALAAFIARQ